MSRLWACDRCGITAPHPAISTGTLPSGWQCVAVRLLPQPVFRDVCPACYAELEEALQSWFLGPVPGDPPRNDQRTSLPFDDLDPRKTRWGGNGGPTESL